jgi:hypothetical protein
MIEYSNADAIWSRPTFGGGLAVIQRQDITSNTQSRARGEKRPIEALNTSVGIHFAHE